MSVPRRESLVRGSLRAAFSLAWNFSPDLAAADHIEHHGDRETTCSCVDLYGGGPGAFSSSLLRVCPRAAGSTRAIFTIGTGMRSKLNRRGVFVSITILRQVKLKLKQRDSKIFACGTAEFEVRWMIEECVFSLYGVFL